MCSSSAIVTGRCRGGKRQVSLFTQYISHGRPRNLPIARQGFGKTASLDQLIGAALERGQFALVEELRQRADGRIVALIEVCSESPEVVHQSIGDGLPCDVGIIESLVPRPITIVR